MNLIRIENLCVNYGAKAVLHGVDLNVNAGEIVTVVGPNGSGKTSLLRAIIGATSPQKGKITLKDNLKIGYVPQRLNFDSSLPMTVERFMHLSNNINNRAGTLRDTWILLYFIYWIVYIGRCFR